MTFLFLDFVLIDIVIAPSQSSIKSYTSTRSLQPPQELLDRNLFNWAIGTMQSFTLFDNPLFREIWHDIPGLASTTLYESSSSFSRRVDKEFVKAHH